MRKTQRFFSLFIALCMVMSIACSASTLEYNQNTGYVDVLTQDLARGAQWPTDPWDLIGNPYSGRIESIYSGNGVYASYYFGCSGTGTLNVSASILSSSPQASNDRFTIEIYNKETKDLVVSYAFGDKTYDGSTLSHTFTDLSSAVLYVVRFLNASTNSGATIRMSGNVSVSHP